MLHMAEDLIDEINAAVHARLRVRDIPKAIWDAAVKEVSEENSAHPMADVWEKIMRRVVEKLVGEEFARRVAGGTVVEVPMANGETGYVRKEEP
jgi:hypothetical protein